jgi:hypothetical protein
MVLQIEVVAVAVLAVMEPLEMVATAVLALSSSKYLTT